MSVEPTPNDIDEATEKLADKPGLILAVFEQDSFWKDLVTQCYADCEALRESFARMYAGSIDTLARQIAAERAQEEADAAAEDARFEEMMAQEKAA